MLNRLNTPTNCLIFTTFAYTKYIHITHETQRPKMNVIDILKAQTSPKFSFEVLPPLKGKSINQLFKNIDSLMEFKPNYINITTHRSELVYKSIQGGLYQRVSERNRPGTVAVAAAIQNKYNIVAVPHLICSGFSRVETEYALIDLNFLGISNLLLLRGDKAKHDSRFIPNEGGNAHACELIDQVNTFNSGCFCDGTSMDVVSGTKFTYGVAGYPEKHDEAPNLDFDLQMLKNKVDKGADYIVTQMFFDNEKFFDFVRRCREIGINVPIIPGIKPISKTYQMNVLPKIFHVDMPTALTEELAKCKDDNAAKEVGIEWCYAQSKELIEHGFTNIHYYTTMATQSVRKVAERLF